MKSIFKNENEQKLLESGLVLFVTTTILFFGIFIYENGWSKFDDFLGFQPYVATIWSFISSFFWMLVIYKYDFYKKENLETMGKLAFISFILIFFITGFINYSIKTYFGDLSSYLAVGFVEEGTKVLILLYFIYNAKDFDEPMDGVFYAAVIAVTFSFVENIGYYNIYILQESNSDSEMVYYLVFRFFTTLLHIVMTAIAGFMIGLYKFGYTTKTKVAIAFLISAIIHSAYDTFCYYEKLDYALIIFCINVYIIFFAFIYLNRISPYNRNYLFMCKSCGYLIRENSVKCPRCDKKVSLYDTIFNNYKIYCTRCQTEVNRKDKICRDCRFEFKI